MRIRGACNRDFDSIESLAKAADVNVDYKHLEMIAVVTDDDDKIIAFGSLVTVLEAAFVVDPSYSRKKRAIALQALVGQADKDVKGLGYERFYAFAGDKIIRILERKFDFLYAKGVNMLRWVK